MSAHEGAWWQHEQRAPASQKRDGHAEEQIQAAKDPPTDLEKLIDHSNGDTGPCPRESCVYGVGHPGACADERGEVLPARVPVPSITGIADFVPGESAALPPWMSLEFVCSKLTDILRIDPASPTEDIVHAVRIATVERQEAREHGERMRKQLEAWLAPGGDHDAWQAFSVVCAALEDHAKAGAKLQADYRAALERLSIVAARSARG